VSPVADLSMKLPVGWTVGLAEEDCEVTGCEDVLRPWKLLARLV
jgi:hypothetical protein